MKYPPALPSELAGTPGDPPARPLLRRILVFLLFMAGMSGLRRASRRGHSIQARVVVGLLGRGILRDSAQKVFLSAAHCLTFKPTYACGMSNVLGRNTTFTTYLCASFFVDSFPCFLPDSSSCVAPDSPRTGAGAGMASSWRTHNLRCSARTTELMTT